MEKHKFQPSRLFNADETGVSCVHNNTLKVMSVKGKKQVGRLTSAERGRNVTVLLAINATGDQFIPPLFVFPRARIDNDLKKDAPLGSTFDGQTSGWITKEGFLKWLKAFVERVNPSEKNPVLLIIDGHSSHKDLDVILYAKQNHIHMLSLPPHTSHKLQPLDRSIMKPFKNSYNEACGVWMRKYPNMKITLKDIAGLVNTAFCRICRMELAQSGFQCTGIYPLNRNVFSDLDFAASLSNQSQEGQQISATAGRSVDDSSEVPVAIQIRCLDHSTEAGPSHASPEHQTCEKQEERILNYSGTQSILEEICPLPSTSNIKFKIREDRSEKSEILTSTPFKDQLLAKKALDEDKKQKAEEKRAKAEEKKVEAARKKKLREEKKQIKKEKIAGCKNIENKSKNPLSSKRNVPSNSAKIAVKKILKFDDNVPYTSSSSITYCIICGESVDEDWIQCNGCKQWAHEKCANIEDT